jgi:TRAP-type C4-dicarboxylate transport system substrate-binding protein
MMRFLLRRLSVIGWIVCSLASAPAVAAQFKIATVIPEGSQWMTDIRAAATTIKDRTDGRAVLKFYAGGVMGNDKKVLRKIRIGQLQGAAFTANGIAERYPDIVIYVLPLLFNSYDEADYVREKMDPIFVKGLDDAGFVSFGFAGGGFAKLMGAEPVDHLDDLKGKRVWVPEGDRVSYAAMESLDLAPVVSPITDVLISLESKLLEYIATPPVGAVVLQWYTKVKYVTDLPLAYTVGLLAIDKSAFAELSKSDQDVFREVMTGVYKKFDEQNRIDDQKAEEALLANGLQMVELEPGEKPRWRAAASRASDQLAAEGVFSSALLEQVRQHIANFRTETQQQGQAVSQAR